MASDPRWGKLTVTWKVEYVITAHRYYVRFSVRYNRCMLAHTNGAPQRPTPQRVKWGSDALVASMHDLCRAYETT